VAVVVPSPARSDGFRRDFLHHLRAHVLERIRKLDFLRYGDSVLGDGRCAELLVDDDVSAFGTEGDLHRLGELIDTALESGAGVNVKMEFFGCHVDISVVSG